MKASCRLTIPLSRIFTPERGNLLRATAWLNIVIQLAFPLAGAFTPVMAAEHKTRHFLSQSGDEVPLRTRPYTLAPGESVAPVAKKYNMTVEALRRLNQFRTFARGFDHLQAGDELDVPLAPLPAVAWDDKHPAPSSETADPAGQSVAGLASRIGTFFSGHPDGDAAASLARGMATGKATGEIQQWLSRFGTARVQLDADKNLSLRNSSFDMLVPLWERQDRLLFAQGSLHRTDDRTQANLGMGLRTFQRDWMAGGNVFFDDDLSRYHYRAGLGLEYGRDNLKLSANRYLRLSGWRDAKEPEDYEARPANGWDLRSEAWLPAYPQLGGKLMYEQYYGNEVALFGTDHRQRSPRAVTAGITWTPVPLVTFSAERKQGQSGVSDARFGVDFRIQPGVPWHRQFSPDAVAVLRSLAGSRYDLVDRNNNIVLEYRRKKVIRLHLSPLITGWSGEMKSLGASVNSKYGLDYIDWDAPLLLARGGKIVADGAGGYNVVLPAWQYDAQGSNTYTVGGVAVDKKGNTSARAEAQVTVTQPAISAISSTLTPPESVMPADGRTQQTLTLSLKDSRGQQVDVGEGEITVSTKEKAYAGKDAVPAAAAKSQPAMTAFRRQSAGIYTAVVTAGTIPDRYSVTPAVRGVSIPEAVISLAADSSTASVTAVALDGDIIMKPASGASSFNYSVTVQDNQGNPVEGAVVEAAADKTGVSVSGGARTGKDGHATVTLTGTTTAVSDIMVTAGTGAQQKKAADRTVSFVADSSTATVTALEVTADNSMADGRAQNAVRATVKDAGGNAVANAAVRLTAPALSIDGKGDSAEVTTDAQGQARVTLTGSVAGQFSVTAAAAADGGKGKTVTVTFVAGQVTQGTIATDKTSYVAGTDMALTVTLKDTQGNPVSGQSALLTAGAVTVANAALKGKWKDNGDGSYAVAYTAVTAGSGLKASLTLSSGRPAESAAYAITAGAVTQGTIATDKTSYVAGTDMALTVTLKDTQGNPVSGQSALLTAGAVTVANAALKGKWKDNGDGSYAVAYTAGTAGSGLKASLTLSSGRPAESAAYAITAGAVTQGTIATDKTSYVAGTDMALTVTLKDTQGNPVSGQSALLTAGAVTVANAALKGKWKDNGDGSYAVAYTAGTAGSGLKASLTLSSGRPAESAAYAITAGAVTQGTIATDKTSYVAGTDMALTVTLKDTQGNPVSGQSALLTAGAVTVANAALKGKWKDNGDGSYAVAYTAVTAGSGLKASLTLSSGRPAESAAYAITAGAVTQGTIATDKTSYVAGTDMALTVTLKDTQGNPVSGQSALLTAGAVTVANAALKGKWKDNGDGSYAVAYTAVTAGSGLKASLTLSSGRPAESAAYAITAGAVTQGTIATDKTSYVAGTDMALTVTLKDTQGNPVSGQSALLTAGAVTVANAALKSDWTDNNDGSYAVAYTAVTAGSGLKASLTLSSGRPAESAAYAITAGAVTQGTIATDKTSYVAGTDMALTVTLKDTQGNPVSGQSALLTAGAVTVANAALKGKWKDNGDGSYAVAYTAGTAGSGLKASLTLSSGRPAESAAYAITAGAVTQGTIATDKTSYVAGTDMALTVTLKDTQGNPVSGQSALLTAGAVTVANAALKGKWKDNGDGSYAVAYTAVTAGSGLKASLTLSSGRPAESAAYAITAGAVTQGTIATDKTSYVAGTDMALTVTLKDTQGNPVSGQSALLTAGAVTVANAALKGKWKDNGDGSYAVAYTAVTAGSGLKASLTLSSGRPAESAAYAITAGAVTQGTIATDKTSYVAGTDMALTVTLKDTQGNPVSGQSALLTAGAVTVANAALKGKWKDNGDGSYAVAYTAGTAGSGLKASLTLSSGRPAESAAYAITAGAVTQGTIATDKTSYVAGTDMALTVTLKDTQGNPVSGQSALLTAGAVTVANAALKGKWKDNGDGSYAVAYTAVTAGSGLKASLTLSSGRPAESAAYAITAGAVTQGTIATDKTSYVAGTDMALTVTLKDTQGNPVSGQSALLTAGAVTVANAALKGKWKDNGDGSYAVAYTAVTAGSGLKASLTLSSGRPAESAAYAITAGAVTQGTIATDKTSYVAGTDMALTVTLKDTQGNPVSGQSALLTAGAVTVANAALKSDWTDNNDGSYAVAYTAVTAGSGLKASLTLSSGRPAESAAYAITAGAVTQGTIATDKTSYVAGTDMALTVTLKDTQGNPVSGQSALLTAGAVTVANAALKGKWKDNGDGSYAVAYTAGTAGSGLKASLTLSSGRPAESAAYAITAGAVTQGTIATDKTSYVAGTDMALTVTLKDTQGNPVSGQSALLTAGAVTVANAALKGKWKDNGDGSYAVAYTAVTAGSGLKASLTLSSGRPAESAAYAITAGAVTQGTIATDKTSYVAGTDMALTVTLKDTQGNPVSGQSALLTAGAVTVANAALKGKWKDNGDGSYAVAYTAGTAGSGLKASLTLSSGRPAESAAYAITAGAVTQGTIATDKTSYVAGTDMALTVTLKDTQGNPVSGQSALLTAGAVTVANAALKSDWTDNNDGSYGATYTATTAGSGLKASLTLSSGRPVASAAYEIYAAPAVKGGRVTISGGLEAGSSELTAEYAFESNGTGEDASTYQWQWRPAGSTDEKDWKNGQQDGHDRRTYKPGRDYAGDEVRVIVTPVGKLHPVLAGAQVISNVVTMYGAPSVANVKAPATSLAGKELDVTYDYSGNGSGSDASSYQWEYRQTPSEGWTVPQSNAAKNRKWTPDASYAGYQVRLTVTPKGSLHPELAGTPVSSDAVSIYDLKAPRITWSACWVVGSIWNRAPELSFTWDTTNIPPGINIVIGDSIRRPASDGKFEKQVVNQETRVYFMDSYGNKSNAITITSLITFSCDTFVNED